MTTAGTTSVTVAEGQTAGVQFGSRLRLATDASEQPDSVADAGSGTIEPTAVDNEAAQSVDAATDGSSNLASFSGLIVLIIAVILLGGILFVVLRRTA
jgi:cobalamin biosynthesis Mg chelatase CobN